MTETHLNSLFSSLESQVERLNGAAEEANTALVAAQQRLVNLNIGIELWFSKPLERSDMTGGVKPNEISTEILSLLGFAKVDGKWCLVIKKVRRESGFFEGDMNCPFTNEYLENQPVALLAQSRSLRLSAIAALPDFLEEISETLSKILKNLPKTQSNLQLV